MRRTQLSLVALLFSDIVLLILNIAILGNFFAGSWDQACLLLISFLLSHAIAECYHKKSHQQAHIIAHLKASIIHIIMISTLIGWLYNLTFLNLLCLTIISSVASGLGLVFRLFFFRFIYPKLPVINVHFIGFSDKITEIIHSKLFREDYALAHLWISTADKPKHTINETFEYTVIDDLSTLPLKKSSQNQNIFVAKAPIVAENDYIDLNDFYERLTGKIVKDNTAWEALSHTSAYRFLSLLLNVALALGIGVIFILTYPLIALLIKADSQGSVFFKHQRVGKDDKTFYLYKYRSMSQTPVTHPLHSTADQFTQKNDPRITKIGHFLRKSRIDELPQIINFLRGDINIIGPRPDTPKTVEKVREILPEAQHRHLIKPGITGWAQINQFYADDLESTIEKNYFDLFYIKNQSIGLDLLICLKTISIIYNRQGQ